MKLKLCVENLSEPDAAFLRGMVSVFSDPKFRPLMDEVRRGTGIIHYGFRGAVRVSIDPNSTLQTPNSKFP
jgi:hypothetical protein